MRQIYLLASDADETAATEIEALLTQRGYTVRRGEEKFSFPPARSQEVTVALWSKAVALSTKQIHFTNRAIDAWTEGRLVFARLDHSLLPRGLGDVEAVDLSFAPARMAGVWKIVEAAQEIDRAMEQTRGSRYDNPPGEAALPDPFSEADERAAGESYISGFAAGHAAIVGVVAAAAFGSAGYISMPEASQLLVGLAAILWGGVAGVAAGYFMTKREVVAPEAAALREAVVPDSIEGDPAVAGPSGVFVSYSRQDGAVVFPMVTEVEASGRPVWIDKQDIEAGSNCAVMIVRAIRESDTFCLMCTAEAFQSDTVRREIYIADKYKRKLLPVRLDFSEMPEDFEYFLIDRQWLDLTTVDAAERAVRLTAALTR